MCSTTDFVPLLSPKILTLQSKTPVHRNGQTDSLLRENTTPEMDKCFGATEALFVKLFHLPVTLVVTLSLGYFTFHLGRETSDCGRHKWLKPAECLQCGPCWKLSCTDTNEPCFLCYPRVLHSVVCRSYTSQRKACVHCRLRT